jgi:hypothetical protein
MWLTSKAPQVLRTAWCSAWMPVNCTAMSQPAKSTSLPPEERAAS